MAALTAPGSRSTGEVPGRPVPVDVKQRACHTATPHRASVFLAGLKNGRDKVNSYTFTVRLQAVAS